MELMQWFFMGVLFTLRVTIIESQASPNTLKVNSTPIKNHCISSIPAS
jgi:hypothetical protein